MCPFRASNLSLGAPGGLAPEAGIADVTRPAVPATGPCGGGPLVHVSGTDADRWCTALRSGDRPLHRRDIALALARAVVRGVVPGRVRRIPAAVERTRPGEGAVQCRCTHAPARCWCGIGRCMGWKVPLSGRDPALIFRRAPLTVGCTLLQRCTTPLQQARRPLIGRCVRSPGVRGGVAGAFDMRALCRVAKAQARSGPCRGLRDHTRNSVFRAVWPVRMGTVFRARRSTDPLHRSGTGIPLENRA